MNVVPSGMPSSKPLLHIVVDPEFIGRLDDFRYANRFPSRSEAMRWLMEAALDAGLTPDRTSSQRSKDR